MAASKIEWTGRSDWNPIRGCTRKSGGCINCYAEIMAARFSLPGQWGHGFAHMVAGDHRWTGKVELIEERLTLPLRWKKPGFVFPSSTSDIFHEALTFDQIDRIFAVMALTPHLTYQLLTKRSDRMRAYMIDFAAGRRYVIEAGRGMDKPGRLAGIMSAARKANPACSPTGALPNVWLGVSVEDQPTANERVPDLLATPAALRWLSCEPLIDPMDLRTIWLRRDGERPTELSNCLGDYVQPLRGNFTDSARIGWVVVGGESGPGARDNNFLANARSLRDQCAATGVPFFGKQNFKKADLPADLQIREMPKCLTR